MPESNDSARPPAPETITIQPPPEVERVPPPVANQVRVIGGADAATIHFYFVSPTRVGNVLQGRPDELISYKDGQLTITSDPVARVHVPYSTMAQLVALLADLLVSGTADLRALASDISERLAALSSKSEPPNG